MHVGLNLVFLVPGETGGMEVAARALIDALAAAEPDLRLTVFVSRDAGLRDGDAWEGRVPVVTVPVRASRRVDWVRGEQWHLPRLARRAGIDVLHSLASTAPLRGRHRSVVTIHDLIYKRYPEAHQRLRALGMRALVPLAARSADRVIAPSQATRDDLVELLRVPADKVDVVHQGVGPVGGPATPEHELRTRLRLGARPIALSLSAKRPHKNLARLIDAIATIPPQRRPVLVVPGYGTWHERELHERAAAAGISDEVRLVGWLGDPDIEGLYAAARCFVFPSLYEGFGLPVLEAMARGVPVACSDRASLPEVAGSAALLFDPERVQDIAAAVERLLGDEQLVERLRRAGPERASRFSWEATARGALASYRRALG